MIPILCTLDDYCLTNIWYIASVTVITILLQLRTMIPSDIINVSAPQHAEVLTKETLLRLDE